MTDTIQTVFVVTALLGLVSLLLPLAQRLSIPYAVLLALVGIAIGGIANLPFASHPGNIVSDVVSWLHDFGLSAESLLYVFCPRCCSRRRSMSTCASSATRSGRFSF
jgi:CPA1 family monovalent cation:H+ antiporter